MKIVELKPENIELDKEEMLLDLMVEIYVSSILKKIDGKSVRIPKDKPEGPK